MKGVDFSQTTTPEAYKCAHCGTSACKLWREYETPRPQLLCVDCAGKDQEKDISSMDEQGRRLISPGSRHRTDQIGWYVPAVPDEAGIGYHGYGDVPAAGCAWWRRLPLRGDPSKAKVTR